MTEQVVTIPHTTEVSLKMDMPGLNIVMDSLQLRSNLTQTLIGSFQSQVNEQIAPFIKALQEKVADQQSAAS